MINFNKSQTILCVANLLYLLSIGLIITSVYLMITVGTTKNTTKPESFMTCNVEKITLINIMI